MGSRIITWALLLAGFAFIWASQSNDASEVKVIGGMIMGAIFICSSAICHVINSKG